MQTQYQIKLLPLTAPNFEQDELYFKLTTLTHILTSPLFQSYTLGCACNTTANSQYLFAVHLFKVNISPVGLPNFEQNLSTTDEPAEGKQLNKIDRIIGLSEFLCTLFDGLFHFMSQKLPVTQP